MSRFTLNMDFRESPQPEKKPVKGTSDSTRDNTSSDGSAESLFNLDNNDSAATESNNKAMTVSQLTRRIKGALETEFERIYLEAEIGSISFPPSGHVYLTLKDEKATLDAVIWRGSASKLSARPQEGDKVLVRGDITVYEPRGRYQMVINSLRPAGEGELRNKFELLVKKLRSEGLFEAEHKKELPSRPQTIGIVTSASGAAVRDIIKVAKKRMPSIKLIVSPCLVQGAQAAASIVRALDNLQKWGGCELIIIGRGGGSLEDLMPFNEESVARAVFNCTTPIISAVGHEVDISVCDLVADARAATPSEAAEIAVPDITAVRDRIRRMQAMLTAALKREITTAKERLRSIARSQIIRDPGRLVYQRRQELDELTGRFIDSAKNMVKSRRQRLLDTASDFKRSANKMVEKRQHLLALSAARLEGLSPLAILARGYSVTLKADGSVITDSSTIKPGERITSRINRGEIISEVIKTEATGE